MAFEAVRRRAMNELSPWEACWRWVYWNYQLGGWGMYPIALWMTIAIAIILERVWVLSRCTRRPEALLDAVRMAVMSGDLSMAVRACERHAIPVASVLRRGLLVAHEERRLIQGEMDVEAMAQSRRLWARTPYMPVLGNLALLSGILGTITGLVKSSCCCCCEPVDPSQKARILAEGISEAMNCTAFGLGVAVLCVGAFAVLKGRAQRAQDDMDANAVQVMNLVLTNLHRMQP